MSDIKLLPCPFCGEADHLTIQPIGSMTADMPDRPHRVICRHIDHDSVEGPVAYGRYWAAVAWNRRAALKAQLAELAAENERLKVEVGECMLVIEQQDRHIDALSRTSAPECQQPVAYRIHALEDEHYGTGPDRLQFHPLTQHELDEGCQQTPLYTRPSGQAVTEAMVEAGARAIAKAWGEDWECFCTERKGLGCDCGNAMTDGRCDSYDERLSREDCRAAARAALTAQEAAHDS